MYGEDISKYMTPEEYNQFKGVIKAITSISDAFLAEHPQFDSIDYRRVPHKGYTSVMLMNDMEIHDFSIWDDGDAGFLVTTTIEADEREAV